MKISIISFTETGIDLSEKLADRWQEAECNLYTKCGTYDGGRKKVHVVSQRVGEWAKEQLEEKTIILFIGACGIAVRAIAPHIVSKLSDSPVLVMDEKGAHVIPILSGHVGGANEIAGLIAEKIGAEPVITTATDIRHTFAIDLFAKKNGLILENREGIARVSSKVLAGKRITVSVEHGHLKNRDRLPEEIELVEYPPSGRVDVVITSEDGGWETELLLKPKEYVIGLGCRKGKEEEKIANFIRTHLQKVGISVWQVFGMASIEVKKEEPGFLAWSHKEKIPFVTYTAEELRSVEGTFHSSAFVREKVGVDNVCERAALKMCGQDGRLVCEKYAEDGMTIAVAKREWSVSFDEE